MHDCRYRKADRHGPDANSCLTAHAEKTFYDELAMRHKSCAEVLMPPYAEDIVSLINISSAKVTLPPESAYRIAVANVAKERRPLRRRIAQANPDKTEGRMNNGKSAD
jgi:hypothetical protein